MSADWQIGDLAVCVDDSPCKCGCYAPVSLRVGQTFRVTAIVTRDVKNDGVLRLALDGYRSLVPHHNDTIGAFRFRKIRPDAHEACESEFVTLLKRSKRKVSA